MKKAIVVGATSGMGKELAQLLAKNNYRVGIIGRRENILNEMVASQPESFIARAYDISKAETSAVLKDLTDELGGLDLMVVTAGFGEPYQRLNNNITRKIININIIGFTYITDWVLDFFLKQGHGHLVSFSSIAGMRGFGVDPAYSASNAFQMNYLEALRQNIYQSGVPIHITDVRPGFVEKSTSGVKTRFWITPLEKATRQIYSAIQRKRKIVYISKRWIILAFLLSIIPTTLFLKLISPYVKPKAKKITFSTKFIKEIKPGTAS